MANNQNRTSILLITVDHDLAEKAMSEPCLEEFKPRVVKAPAEALPMLEHERFDVVFLDVENLPVQEMDLVSFIKRRSARTEVVILTTMRDLEEATSAMRNGAAFYLMKPVGCGDLRSVIERLTVRSELGKESLELEHRILTDLMAGNPQMEKVMKLAMKIAPTSSTVLIGGESGTGKEFFARIIHRMSQRWDGKFVAMNCGAVPDTLFESELFGHRRGAFTGADRDKSGLVEEANMGTLFLDEVGELSAPAQVKLLRFLQERSFRRVGETELRTVNVRIIAATNKDLTSMVSAGTFREDLFYRLNVFYLHLPPLRERKETIPNLIRLFVHRFNTLLDKNVNKISKAAEAVLASYAYPGNVRELENIIEHAMVLVDGNEITERELPEFMFKGRLLLTAPPKEGPGGEVEIPTLAEMEKRHIDMALRALDYNYTETAKQLGVSRSTLWRKIREYGLEKK
jgi:DNA-binding NtrC family response regulator